MRERASLNLAMLEKSHSPVVLSILLTPQYDLTYTTAKNLRGPWSPTGIAAPKCGNAKPFQDKDGNWWAPFFGNHFFGPWRDMPGAYPTRVIRYADGLRLEPVQSIESETTVARIDTDEEGIIKEERALLSRWPSSIWPSELKWSPSWVGRSEEKTDPLKISSLFPWLLLSFVFTTMPIDEWHV